MTLGPDICKQIGTLVIHCRLSHGSGLEGPDPRVHAFLYTSRERARGEKADYKRVKQRKTGLEGAFFIRISPYWGANMGSVGDFRGSGVVGVDQLALGPVVLKGLLLGIKQHHQITQTKGAGGQTHYGLTDLEARAIG